MSRTTKISRLLQKYSSYKITKEELRKLLASGAFRMSGVAGPFVIRYKNDKPIISERPILFRMSMTSAAVKGRNSFTAGIRFAKFLADIEDIKQIWQPANTLCKTAWLNLVKYNYTSDIPGIKNTVTPPENLILINQISALTEDFRITIDRKFNSQERLLIIIVPYNSVTKTYDIISTGGLVQKNEIKLSEEQIKILKQFPNYIMYTAVIRRNGSAVEWSNTVVTQGTIAAEYSEEQSVFIRILLFLIYEYHLPYRRHTMFSG